jgi:hypothetical protein
VKVGFTGTRYGMNSIQAKIFAEFIGSLPLTEFHHGDCLGADHQAHDIVRHVHPAAMIVGHPPIAKTGRAYCKFDLEFEAKPYIERNHEIVDSTQFLVATPKEVQEKLRSGTWSTVRYADKLGRKMLIILPERR